MLWELITNISFGLFPLGVVPFSYFSMFKKVNEIKGNPILFFSALWDSTFFSFNQRLRRFDFLTISARKKWFCEPRGSSFMIIGTVIFPQIWFSRCFSFSKSVFEYRVYLACFWWELWAFSQWLFLHIYERPSFFGTAASKKKRLTIFLNRA